MSGARCQSCGRPLLFVENVKSDRRLPLVDTPLGGLVTQDMVKPGMVIVSPNRRKGKVLTLKDIADWSESLQEAIGDNRLHQTHFQDCRDREDWSGSSRAARRARA